MGVEGIEIVKKFEKIQKYRRLLQFSANTHSLHYYCCCWLGAGGIAGQPAKGSAPRPAVASSSQAVSQPADGSAPRPAAVSSQVSSRVVQPALKLREKASQSQQRMDRPESYSISSFVLQKCPAKTYPPIHHSISARKQKVGMNHKLISYIQIPNEGPAFAAYMPELSSINPNKQPSLVVSTYQLNPKLQEQAPELNHQTSESRCGSILLLSTSSASTSQQLNPVGLTITHRIRTDGGVFRFEAIDSHKILAALTSGKLAIMDLSEICRKKEVDDACGSTSTSDELSTGMMLNASLSKSTQEIVCSDNLGDLMTVDCNTLKLARKWKAHNFKYTEAACEVWTCCWIDGDQQVCASGAEDCQLKVWDIRSDCSTPVQTNSKTHSSGVTFVKNSVCNSHHLITGSYDEYLRIFDTRNIKNPLKEIKLNGGVWHVEEMEESNFLLAACMYGGWNIINLQDDTCYTNQDQGANLLYGATSGKAAAKDTFTIASCIFNNKSVYEHQLKIRE
uniref:methylated diphthine methylhydrolase n=1 Tax=Ditylenchus dipsaci TaxID=166011 RepID=A0A915DL83_9BILA